MKKIFVLSGLLLGAFMIAGCSNDDEKAPNRIEIEVEAPNCAVAVNPIELPDEGLAIYYCLRNPEGEPTTTFKYGEDIIFDLHIENCTDENIFIAGEEHAKPKLFTTPYLERDVKNGLFNVCTKSGKYVGYPYDKGYRYDLPSEKDYNPVTKVWAKNDILYLPTRWTASWQGKVYEDYQYGRRFSYYDSGTDNEPLPVGEYYSQFDVNLGKGATYPVRVDFRVVE